MTRDASQHFPKPRATETPASSSHAQIAIDDARRAGLLDGERTRHLSFRVPEALLEAAQRELGRTSPTEVGIAALALLAQPDPFKAFLKRSRGRLGRDHTLEF